MVLDPCGGAGAVRAPLAADERGAQSVEFALTLPLVLLALTVLAHLAIVATDLVAAHSVAFQAARIAAVDDDAAVARAVRDAAGRRPVEVTLDPVAPQREVGDVVTASVRLRSAAFATFGMTVWLPATASLRVERQ